MTPEQLSCLSDLCLQKMEAGALGDWLLEARPTSSTATGYQSSKNPEDWLLSQQESQVREMNFSMSESHIFYSDRTNQEVTKG